MHAHTCTHHSAVGTCQPQSECLAKGGSLLLLCQFEGLGGDFLAFHKKQKLRPRLHFYSLENLVKYGNPWNQHSWIKGAFWTGRKNTEKAT